MRWVDVHIIISVLSTFKFHDESVCDAILHRVGLVYFRIFQKSVVLKLGHNTYLESFRGVIRAARCRFDIRLLRGRMDARVLQSQHALGNLCTVKLSSAVCEVHGRQQQETDIVDLIRPS
jgi:hypothetical protein